MTATLTKPDPTPARLDRARSLAHPALRYDVCTVCKARGITTCTTCGRTAP